MHSEWPRPQLRPATITPLHVSSVSISKQCATKNQCLHQFCSASFQAEASLCQRFANLANIAAVALASIKRSRVGCNVWVWNGCTIHVQMQCS
eukprot:scaffold465308_cov21-Prasinocladus_malaysianus.AAC.2